MNTNLYTQYLSRGLSLIPVKGKIPIIENWQRFCESQMDEKTAELFDEKYSQFGIGLPCGPANKLVCVDIDSLDKKIHNIIPPSPIRREGRPGREVRFFKYTENIKSQNLLHVGIEILSIGRQVVLPPSIHPDTNKPYQWMTPDNLLDYNLNDLPVLDLSFLSKITKDLHVISSTEGRNNKLKAIVTSMRARGESEPDIVREVYNYDLNFNEPRLFTDQSEQFRAKNENEAINSAWLFVNSVTRSLIKSNVAFIDTRQIQEADISEINKSLKELKKEYDFKPYPKPRGIMKDFYEACDLMSKSNQDALALGGALILMAGLCSNRFKTNVRGLDVWPNLYVVNLGYSGFGKEVCQDLITRILPPDSNLLGASNYRSGTSIVVGLPKQQERIDLVDECSGLLHAMASDETYKKEIVDILSLLYSKSNSQFNGFTSVGHGERYGACFNPCVNLLGSTTPMGFSSTINKEMAAKGLLPRFLVFFQYKVGKYRGRNKKTVLELNKRIDKLRTAITKFLILKKRIDDSMPKNYLAEEVGKDGKDVSMGIKYDPYLIKMTEETYNVWIDYEEKNHYAAAEDPEKYESAFLNRFAQNAAKLSLLDAVSLGQEQIELHNLEWAIELVEAQWHNIKQFYEIASGENKIETDKIRVLDFIKKKGIVDKSTLILKTRWLTKNQREEILKELEIADAIEMVKQSSEKKPKTMYRFISI